MAERRMFTSQIINSDAFQDMPLSTQALYFHLGMKADDDGFLGNPKRIQKMVGASEDDMKLLQMKRFVYLFDTGICVIKHWKMHNYIPKDRYKNTAYEQEKAMLELKKNKSYKVKNDDCIRDGYTLYTDCIPRLGKVRLDKDLNTNEQILEEFALLWKLYPNKKGKNDASKHYQKSRTRKNDAVEYETVKKGIENYIAFIKAEGIEKKFIKHGSTWFNQECWNDDYSIEDKKECESTSKKDIPNYELL